MFSQFSPQGGYHWSLHFTTFISVEKIDITAFIIRLSMIVRVNTVLNRTVVVDSYTVRTAVTRTIDHTQPPTYEMPHVSKHFT